MEYNFTDTQKAIIDTAREIGEKFIKPIRMEADEHEKFPWSVVDEMRKADLFGIYIHPNYGGLGGGGFELVLAVEELSRFCGGIALALAASALGAFPIILYGTKEQKKRFLPDIASGKRLAAFCITEPGAGSDATASTATAKKDGDFYILNGIKNFCSNGEAAEVYTVFFSTNPSRGARGVSCFVIEKGTPGFTFGKKEKKMGIRASNTYELYFENCRVPASNLIGGEGKGLFVAQATFDLSRPGVASQALGIAQGAFDETLAYGRNRRQFGQNILSFQSSQHMMADMATNIEAGRSLLYGVARGMDVTFSPSWDEAEKNGEFVADVMRKNSKKRWTKESGMVKLYCSEMSMKVTTDCVQLAGGIGYMRDFPIEKYMRDAKITQIYEGTNQIQRNEIGAMITKELASQAK